MQTYSNHHFWYPQGDLNTITTHAILNEASGLWRNIWICLEASIQNKPGLLFMPESIETIMFEATGHKSWHQGESDGPK